MGEEKEYDELGQKIVLGHLAYPLFCSFDRQCTFPSRVRLTRALGVWRQHLNAGLEQ